MSVEIPSGTEKKIPIQVAEKIIADISTGIYRTPAAALKELVSNAYDADATRVEISTGVPDFRELVIRDNGSGMSAERFAEVVQHIGGSWKRLDSPGGLSPVYQRPLIGRIGIGLLAVAQLGQRFYVSSTVRGSGTRFIAEVDLTQFHRDDAALRNMAHSDETVEIGTIRLVDGLPEKQDTHYTVITVPDPKQGLVSEMFNQLRSLMKAPQKFSVSARAKSFAELVAATLEHNRADAVLDGYHYILWELGLLSPIRYLPGPVFDSSKRHIIGSFDPHEEDPKKFSVFVDRIELFRPIRYPTPVAVKYGGPDPKIYPISFNESVAGRALRFGGYIYAQKPRIQPLELQGVEIRIRGVGIGPFDKSWMGYPFDEGIKFGQLTGEIFVHDGLESALNIDRSSFRETDPHYLAVRATLWSVLKSQVFPEFKSRQRTHRANLQEEQQQAHRQRLNSALSDAPEPVGVAPRISKSGGGEESSHAVVAVVAGEVEVSQQLFSTLVREYGLSKTAEQRLLDVFVALAAYGVWQQISFEDARSLVNALAVAVAND